MSTLSTAMDSNINENRDSSISTSAVAINSQSTKDESDTHDDLELEDEDENGSGSLVQRRMRIFEKQQILISAKPLPFIKKPDNVQANIDPGGEVDKNPEQPESRKLDKSDSLRNLEPERKSMEESVKQTDEPSSNVVENCELKEENVVIEPSEMDNKEVKTEEEKSDEIKTEENTNVVEENESVQMAESIDLEIKKEEEEINEEEEESSTVPEESIISTVTTTNESDYPDELNPFGSEEEEEENEEKSLNVKSLESNKSPPPRPPPPDLTKRTVVPAPKVNLNPFWSDDEGPSSDEENTEISKPPIPKPRTLKTHPVAPEPSPAPRRSLPAPSSLSPLSIYGSVSSLSSLASSSGGGSTARRKKKPAPAPPSVRELFPEQKANVSAESSRTSSPTPFNISAGQSPRPGRHRKARPAPPPPPPLPPMSPISPDQQNIQLRHSTPGTFSSWDRQKVDKDQANRNRQSHSQCGLQ